MSGNRMVTHNHTARIYEKILRDENYSDILENIRIKHHRKEIMEKIERYRPVENKDMSIAHRVKVTGLTRNTCENLNRVYTRVIGYAATPLPIENSQ